MYINITHTYSSYKLYLKPSITQGDCMTQMMYLTKYEHQVLPKLREQLNQSESVEDVKKFFVSTVQEFFELATEGKIQMEYEDISLIPDSKPYYSLSKNVKDCDEIKNMADSDLNAVLQRLAEQAAHRHIHIAKNNTKTNLKIRGH